MEPETTINAIRPAPSIGRARSHVVLSHLVVLTDFDDIPFTFAPGIRKRFQSTPNALETCCFATPKTRPRLSSYDKGEPRRMLVHRYCSGTLAAAT
jgi:hypothetical protein